MRKILQWLVFGFIALALTACGGDGGSGSGSGEGNATSDGSTPVATTKLKKTGQVKSYNRYGNEITDGSLKDDGYYQAGVASSYERDDANEVVLDHVTGLMWQDNIDAKTVTKPRLTRSNYYAQDMNNTTGDTAATYCTNLSLGDYSDWRLPTINELMYITDKTKEHPAIDTNVFKNIVADRYLSSDTLANFPGVALGVDFEEGRDDGYFAIDSHYVRCVRGSFSMSHNFSRDNAKQIVTDSEMRVQWQDNEIGNAKTWTDAINYCESLTLGGHTDWRLPNFNELYYLADRTKREPAASVVFQNIVPAEYWSSTTISGDYKNHAWGVNFKKGNDFRDVKLSDYNVRCVRSGQ